MLTPVLFGGIASMWSMEAAYLLMAAVAALGIVPVLFMTRGRAAE